MVCHIMNHLPTPVISNLSPFENLFNSPPNYSYLYVFGYECWPYLWPFYHHKMHFHSHRCIFLGYSDHHRRFKCLEPSFGRIFLSCHVIFNEFNFPFMDLSSSAVASHSHHVPVPSSLRLSSPLDEPSISGTPVLPFAISLPQTNESSSTPCQDPPSPSTLAMCQPQTHPMQTWLQDNISIPKKYTTVIVC